MGTLKRDIYSLLALCILTFGILSLFHNRPRVINNLKLYVSVVDWEYFGPRSEVAEQIWQLNVDDLNVIALDQSVYDESYYGAYVVWQEDSFTFYWKGSDCAKTPRLVIEMQGESSKIIVYPDHKIDFSLPATCQDSLEAHAFRVQLDTHFSHTAWSYEIAVGSYKRHG